MIELTKSESSTLPSSELVSFKIKIINVVATVNLNIQLDLDYIEKNFKDVRRRTRFPGLMVSLTNPKVTILMFHSGKCVLTGVQYPGKVDEIVAVLVKKLEKIEIHHCNPVVRINNIVSHGNFHRFIDLDKLLLKLPYTIYEPEIFPGVIYKMKEYSSSVLIFTNGKFILTGNNNIEDLKRSAKYLAILLKQIDCFSRFQTDPSLSLPSSLMLEQLLD